MHDGRPFTSKKSKKRGGHRDDTQVMLNIIHGRGTVTRGQDWSFEEDAMIEHYQKEWGSKWSKMAKVFNNGRNDKEISRRFTTLQRARQRAQHRRMETELDNVVDDEELSDSGDEDYSSYGSEARTEQVQNLVRAALAKDRRGGRVSRSQDFTVNNTTSHPKAKRSRKPSRRVQESYSALEDDSSSSYMSEGEDAVNSSYHGNSIAAAIPKMLDASSKKQFFPDILFRLVNECSTYQPHVLDWIPDGTAFVVKEPTLMPEILSRYFRHNKLSSLTRMCYFYGWTKTKDDILGRGTTGAFVHPHFTRDSTRESLFANITKIGTQSNSPGRPRKNRNLPISSKSKKVVNRQQPVAALAIQPTANDTLISLSDANYKELMFSEYRKLGKKTSSETPDQIRHVARQIYETMADKMKGSDGQFVKYDRVTGKYEIADESWTLTSKCSLSVYIS